MHMVDTFFYWLRVLRSRETEDTGVESDAVEEEDHDRVVQLTSLDNNSQSAEGRLKYLF